MNEPKQTAIRKICELNREALFKAMEGFLDMEDVWPTETNNEVLEVELGIHCSSELRRGVRSQTSDQAAEVVQHPPVEKRRKTVQIVLLSVGEIGDKVGREDFHRVGAIPDELCKAIKQIEYIDKASTETVLQILWQKKIPKKKRRVIIPTKELANGDDLCFLVIEQRDDGPRLEVTTDGEPWAPEVLVAVVLKDPPSNGQDPSSSTEKTPSPVLS